MIKQLYIEGFKSFAEPVYANLDNLLVIAGSNSGGKSTIIQALLLLAQTLDNQRPDVVLDMGGNYLQFAEFSEAVYGRSTKLINGFTIGFDLDVEEVDSLFDDQYKGSFILRSFIYTNRKSKKAVLSKTTNRVIIRITFGVDRSGRPFIQSTTYNKFITNLGTILLSLERDRRSNYRIKLQFKSNTGKKDLSPTFIIDQLKNLLLESETISNPRSRELSPLHLFSVSLFQFGIDINKIPIIGNELVKILDDSPKVEINREKTTNLLTEIIKFTFQEGLETTTSQKIPFDHFLIPTTSRVYPINEELGRPKLDPNVYPYMVIFESLFSLSLDEIKGFLGKIRYIGPLRAKPERAYLAMGSPLNIGNAGENAVPILWLYQNERITNKTIIGAESSECKLVQAVQDWLQEFGIAYSFHITKPKRVIYQAELESSPGSKVMVTIADVGFGVSQLLPVIIASLRAPKNSTIILEQPEIHLHPRLQGKLADFLICMVELGKNVIVETHSEHLINMLRLRIAQDKSGKLQKKIGIIFVRNWQQMLQTQRIEEGLNRRGSYIENLRVDEFGKIINWPPDFFPETTDINEEILKAMMEKFPEGE